MTRALLALAFALPGCFASAERDEPAPDRVELPACNESQTEAGRMQCDELGGGCSVTYVACAADPGPALGISCVPFPELNEWRCYW